MGASPKATGLAGAAAPEPHAGLGPADGIPSADFLSQLRALNSSRLKAWEGDNKADPLFHAAELGGEVGELLNVVKKLHREAMGWRGSRATLPELEDEIGDVLICLDKLAAQYDIDLSAVTAAKFNKTSGKVGLPHKLIEPQWLCEHCGASQQARSPLCVPPFTVRPHAFTGHHPADKFRAAARQGDAQ